MKSWRLLGLNSSNRWDNTIAAWLSVVLVRKVVLVWSSNNKWPFCSERSRARARYVIVDAFSSQLSVLSRQVGDLQADNLKLYEKIRFLQVIAEDNTKCWKQFPQACGGGSRRSEVVVPVENRHGINTTYTFSGTQTGWLKSRLLQVPRELWAETGPFLQLQQARKTKEVRPTLCLWEGDSSWI